MTEQIGMKWTCYKVLQETIKPLEERIKVLEDKLEGNNEYKNKK